MNSKFGRYFIYSAFGVLLVTGLAKIISVFGSSAALKTSDPVFGFQFRILFLIAGSVEVIAALLCLLASRMEIRAGIVAWIATTLLGYRFAMMWLHYQKPCSCLGNMTDALHISPTTAEIAMKVILAYLLIGSYAVLFSIWRQKRTSSRVPGAGIVTSGA